MKAPRYSVYYQRNEITVDSIFKVEGIRIYYFWEKIVPVVDDSEKKILPMAVFKHRFDWMGKQLFLVHELICYWKKHEWPTVLNIFKYLNYTPS